MHSGYDIIGDVHGQADALRALLGKLGYAERGGAFRHPERQAIFLGDLVDRGPGQLETLGLVRRMRDAGAAQVLMGNHEFNAVAYTIADPRRPGEFLRTHHSARYGDRNREQHQAFLREVEHDLVLYAEWIAWFLTLPLWLEMEEARSRGLRAVHACWHPEHLKNLKRRLGPSACLTVELMAEAAGKSDAPAAGDEPSLCASVEMVLKGPELRLPPDLDFRDTWGIPRRRVRQRWWDREATTLRSAVIVDRAVRARVPETRLPKSALVPYPRRLPIFVGHYGFTDEPEVLAPTVACVDWGAGKGVRLCAYRWSGEERLSVGNFVCVDVGSGGAGGGGK